jgi:hypothetical protein
MPDDIAALIDLAIDRATMSRLYMLGLLSVDDEAEDQAEALAEALSTLSRIAVDHGIRV